MQNRSRLCYTYNMKNKWFPVLLIVVTAAVMLVGCMPEIATRNVKGIESDGLQHTDGYDDYQGYVFGDGKERYNMLFRMKSPATEAGKIYPLIVYLPPEKTEGTDNEKQMNYYLIRGVQNNGQDAFVVLPQLVKEKFAFGDAKGKSSKASQLEALIEALAAQYPVDRNRIYLTGVGQGSLAVWEQLTRSKTYAAAMPIGYGADPATAEKVDDIPIWACHNIDDSAVPVTTTDKMVEALRARGVVVNYTRYEHLASGKEAYQEFYFDKEVWAWLFRQYRGRELGKE